MKYLIFSELSRNHFLFLSYFIISIIKNIVNKQIKTTKDLIQTFNTYYMCTLSDLLSVIPLIIIKIRSKDILNKPRENTKSNSDDRTESSDINYIYTDYAQRNDKRVKRIIKLSILVSIFDFLALYINITYNIIINIHNIVIKKFLLSCDILFNVISKFAFSTLILHMPIYKHHYLSLAINFMVLIGFLIYDITKIPEAKVLFFWLKRLISLVLYSLEDVYAKILLSFDSISPYTYLFYRGIFVNILSLLYSIVFIFVKIPDENGIKSIVFSRFWKVYDNKLNILFYILYFIMNYIYNQNVLLIIDKFSPIHFAVATALEAFGSLIIENCYKFDNPIEFSIKFVIYLILIFAALVYNEFIVFNFCGFQKYTTSSLRRKSCAELELSLFNENEFFPEDDDDKNELVQEDENNKNAILPEDGDNKNDLDNMNNESGETNKNDYIN